MVRNTKYMYKYTISDYCYFSLVEIGEQSSAIVVFFNFFSLIVSGVRCRICSGFG